MYDFHASTDTKEQYTFYYTFLESKIICVVCIYSTVHVPNLNSNYFKNMCKHSTLIGYIRKMFS